jgi:PadR family transcriptional regulator PadR
VIHKKRIVGVRLDGAGDALSVLRSKDEGSPGRVCLVRGRFGPLRPFGSTCDRSMAARWEGVNREAVAIPCLQKLAEVYVEVRGNVAPPKIDLPQGTLDLLILQVVALGPIHGYGISQRLLQLSRDVVQVPQGSLYPALHRLENKGLLAAEWKASDTGRDAKFYRLTPKGRVQLKEESVNWARLTDAIRLILRDATGGAL